MNLFGWINSRPQKNGNVVAYWSIENISINPNTFASVVTIHGYASEEKYTEDKVGNKILEKSVEIDFSPMNQNGLFAPGIVALTRAKAEAP